MILRYLYLAWQGLMLVLAIVGLACSSQAHAQNGGWVATGATGTYPSAYAACEAQWQHYMNNGYSRYIGAFPNPDNWAKAACEWTRYQYLCPAETGGDFQCGTIIPHVASFACDPGYTAIADGHCLPNPPVEKPPTCPANGGFDPFPDKPNPTVGNPIVLSTGAKSLSARDYETADGISVSAVITEAFRSAAL